MVDGLAAPAADVGDEPVARRRRSPPSRASSAATANSRPSSGPSASVRSAADAMCRRGMQQDVGRGARGDVAEGDDEVVLVDARRRDLAGDDPAEQAVGHGGSFGHQSTGFELIRNPIVPTSPAIRYDT